MQTISTPQILKSLRKLKKSLTTQGQWCLILWTLMFLRDNALIWCDCSRPSSLAGSNSSTSLPFFLYWARGNSGEFTAGLILVDLCAMCWYCPVLLLDSLVSTKTVIKWSNWPMAWTVFSRKQSGLKRSLTEEFGYSWTKKYLYIVKLPFCQQLQMFGRKKASSSNTENN